MPRQGRRRKRSPRQWRRLIRAATFIAILTSPIPFLWLYVQRDWPLGWSIVVTFLLIIAYRGLLDVVLRRMIPWPSLFGADERSSETRTSSTGAAPGTGVASGTWRT